MEASIRVCLFDTDGPVCGEKGARPERALAQTRMITAILIGLLVLAYLLGYGTRAAISSRRRLWHRKNDRLPPADRKRWLERWRQVHQKSRA